MHRLVLIVLLMIGFQLNAQTLKKKYTGTFKGELPAYFLPVDNGSVVQVNEATVSVLLQKSGEVYEQVGALQLKGRIVALTSTKTGLNFEVDYNDQVFNVKYNYIKKTNTLERIGFYPQPTCLLIKTE